MSASLSSFTFVLMALGSRMVGAAVVSGPSSIFEVARRESEFALSGLVRVRGNRPFAIDWIPELRYPS